MALVANTRIQLLVDTIEKKDVKITVTFAQIEFMPSLCAISKERRPYLKDTHDVIELPRSKQVAVSQTDIDQVFHFLREMGDAKQINEISSFLCDFVLSKRCNLIETMTREFPALATTSLTNWSTCDNLDGLWNAAYILQINWLNWLVAILRQERKRASAGHSAFEKVIV